MSSGPTVVSTLPTTGWRPLVFLSHISRANVTGSACATNPDTVPSASFTAVAAWLVGS